MLTRANFLLTNWNFLHKRSYDQASLVLRLWRIYTNILRTFDIFFKDNCIWFKNMWNGQCRKSFLLNLINFNV